jgi:hypothetical protein
MTVRVKTAAVITGGHGGVPGACPEPVEGSRAFRDLANFTVRESRASYQGTALTVPQAQLI